jgi:hypothetical protein
MYGLRWLVAILGAAVLTTGEAEEAAVQRLKLIDDLRGTVPMSLGDTDLELAGGNLRAPVHLSGTLSVSSRTIPRVFTGRIVTSEVLPSPPQASFVVRSLRKVTQDDWRLTQTIAGRREDRLIHLPNAQWGTPAERKSWGISGTDDNWEEVSIQYDGWVRVEADQVDLATRSDNSSRMWIDRNGDGKVGPGEWAFNGWGTQAAGMQVLHRAVPRGFYRYRIQVEESLGDNYVSLLWNDAQHSAGDLDGLQIVPASSYARPSTVALSGEQELSVQAKIDGPGGLELTGPDVVWQPGASCSGPLRVRRGTLRLEADLRVPVLEVAAGANLIVGPYHVMAGEVRTEGGISLAGGSIEITAAGASTIATLAGLGALRIDGGARVRLGDPGKVTVEVLRGELMRAERALTSGTVQVTAGLGGDFPVALSGPGSCTLTAEVEVPADAPRDLGILAYLRDRHESWYQVAWPVPLTPGRHQLTMTFDPEAVVASAVGDPNWNADSAARSERAGLHLWSAQGGGGAIRIRVEAVSAAALSSSSSSSSPPARLLSLRTDGAVLHTGKRWELSCLPQPFPADPYDQEAFTLDAEFTGPDGRRERVAGFYMVPNSIRDGGDRVVVRADGDPAFHLRWRPRIPGDWRCRLTARWRGGATASSDLALHVEGPAWDGYLRVDKQDRRFFAVDGAFFWPVGINLHAVTDVRSNEYFKSQLTPQRGQLAYGTYFDRFAGAGVNLAEVWMSAWNLGIEWSAYRPGFAGAGRYNQGNAAQLDALLDDAWAREVRIVLAVNHLGQGSNWCASEWKLHPYERSNGGWLDKTAELFTDPRALAYQERYRRYLIARWGDHPAVACWKLWTEIDLTDMHGNTIAWHERASKRWRELDPYAHLITTHWCGTYGNVDTRVVALPNIDMATIDAYHEVSLLAELLRASTLDPKRGLAKTGKPVLVTEYGAQWNGGSREQLHAETASAPFVGLVAGHAGAPMCWWFEVLDQSGWFEGYRAIRAFIAGEDLRGAQARGVNLQVEGAEAPQLWAKAWQRPGRLLGYVLDQQWGIHGGNAEAYVGVGITVGVVSPGKMQLEWWDADTGTVISRQRLEHDGGALTLTSPAWRRHVAFKLWREP